MAINNACEERSIGVAARKSVYLCRRERCRGQPLTPECAAGKAVHVEGLASPEVDLHQCLVTRAVKTAGSGELP